MNENLTRFYSFAASVQNKKPEMPADDLGIFEAEYHASINVQVAENWLPDYVVEPQRNLYESSNADLTHLLANNQITVDDMTLEIDRIAVANGGWI